MAAHPPGQLRVAPLFLGGGGLGHHPPAVTGGLEVVGLLHQEAARDLAQVQGLGARSRCLQEPGVPALAHQGLDGSRLVGGRDHHIGLRAGDHLLGRGRVEGPVQGDHAPEGRALVALQRQPVGGGQVGGHGHPARVGVLDDGRGGAVPHVVDQAPGGLGVVEVEVGQGQARVLHDLVPPGPAADGAVAGPLLVGVLAVSQLLLGAGQGKVEGRRQRLPRLCRAVHPGHDGRVVGGGVGEGGPGQPAPRRLGEGAVTPQLVEHASVLAGIDDDADVVVVLGRGPHHGRAPDVDGLDGGLGHERVQVAHHQVDGLDALGGQVGQVLVLGPVGQDPPVDLGVQGLDPAPQHGRGAGDGLDLDVGYAPGGQGLRRPPAGDELPPQPHQTAGQALQPRLVVDGEKRPHGVAPWAASMKSRMVAG